MSELQRSRHEHQEQLVDDKEIAERRNELLKEVHEKAERARNEHAENIEKIRHEIEQEAASSKESLGDENKQDEPDSTDTYWYSNEYRELAFKQLLSSVRGHLTTPERLASRIIHQPLVEQVSEITGKTVARPSGVLTGSIFSFIASIAVYYFAKQNGYDMTYGIFALSFIGGFLLGVVIEFSARGIRALLSRS